MERSVDLFVIQVLFELKRRIGHTLWGYLHFQEFSHGSFVGLLSFVELSLRNFERRCATSSL
jgi:hypothetical protein